MPCNSDYMEPNCWEQELSKVACLLDELEGKPLNSSHWAGSHPKVYCQGLSRKDGDALVESLCSALQKKNVKKYSLEMQIWWRDHQAADQARIQKEIEKKKTDGEKKAAIAKLNKHERKLLGL